jgi:hypothetical protein
MGTEELCQLPPGCIDVEWHGTSGKLTLTAGTTAGLANGHVVMGPGQISCVRLG